MFINTRIETRRYELICVLIESSITHSISRSDLAPPNILVLSEKTIKSYQSKSSFDIVNPILRGYAEYNLYITKSCDMIGYKDNRQCFKTIT